ncbi:MAG: 30S ribosomal protein S14 [archaeon]
MPKKRANGLAQSVCRVCGKKGRGVIQKYKLSYCRRCFRDFAKSMGFKKYN